MIRWIAITVLAVSVTATAVWGYQEHREKNAILIQAENNYQRSFHDLSYHMDLLQDKIGTTLAMDSREQISPQMAEVWRLTSEAQADVSQLPLALLPFNKTEEFLSKIGDFTYRTAVRDLDKEPLTDEEVKYLSSLYDQSGQITKELRKVQNLVLKDNLRWMDVQVALASNDKQADNTIVDGFKTVEKTVSGFDEGNFGPSLTGTSRENKPYRFVKGEKLSKEQGEDRARKLFNIKDNINLNITETGKGSDLPIYSASYRSDGKNGYVDLTQKGGNPINLMIDREIGEQKLSLNEGLEKAEAYLKKYDFDDMEAFQSNQYDNLGVFSFIYKQDGVLIYPDSIQIKVALDNGEILGLSAKDYYQNHTEREIKEPKITAEEARDKVNQNVDIQTNQLAIIENDVGEEVLTHSFLGTLNNETYRIFINAQTGVEESVEKLSTKEEKFDPSL
ncbi:germination protein YpeB [Terrihalobacillus insolitus]|uniref:germination protein YpeB n=1 Tax=Terrihalobacillus insolitus TaxID=2950438 RepID=UPI00233FEE7F|nr:germination protein YpeB [Terrihalobacillus insolitus]MDC3413071.1 germination protein YpeB [Terrihalobacillus insolitus]